MSVLDIARQFHVRARAEVELLATVAPAVRFLVPVAESAGVVMDWFECDDHRLIWAGLRVGRVLPDNRRRALLIRSAMIEAGLWDGEQVIPCITGGSRWGPGSLSTLFCRLSAEPDLVRKSAKRLREVILVQECSHGRAGNLDT